MDKEQYLLSEIRSYIGEPIIKTEFDDDYLLDSRFIEPALLEYYRRCPYEYRIVAPPSQKGVGIDIPDLGIEDSYFLGVVYISKVGVSYLRSDLFPYIFKDATERFGDTIMHLQHYANIEDFFESDVMVNYDTVENKLFVSPYHQSVSLVLGYGFRVINYLPINHLPVVARLAALKLCTTLKVARTSIKLAGDLELDASVFDEVITVLKEQIERDMTAITVPVLLYA